MRGIEDIYKKYVDDLYNYILSLTRDEKEAEEILSETYYRALKGLLGFKGESSFKTWLFSIARYTWYETIRLKEKEVSLKDYILEPSSTSLEDQAINNILAEKIMKYLFQEDDRSIKVFKLRMAGYSHREIGNELKISEASSRVIYHRTRENIREKLRKEGLNEKDFL